MFMQASRNGNWQPEMNPDSTLYSLPSCPGNGGISVSRSLFGRRYLTNLLPRCQVVPAAVESGVETAGKISFFAMGNVESLRVTLG